MPARRLPPRCGAPADPPSGPKSTRSTTSGSRTATRRSKSPSREAARKVLRTSRCVSRSASGTVFSPVLRRWARLASCRVASGERSTIGAISSKGIAKMSCRTNARRSGGDSVSSTTSNARPTESASRASCSGFVSSGRSTIGCGQANAQRLLAPHVARAQHVQRDARDDGRQPAAEIVEAFASERLRRSQASWTLSSASLVEPSIR